MTPILLILSLTFLLQAPSDRSTDREVAENGVQDPTSAPILRPDDDSRIPLLREGVFLNHVPGSIRFDEGSGLWRFHNDIAEDSQTTRFGRTFGMLPSSALADAVDLIQTTDEVRHFEVSARVTVYRGMNYLLPTLVTAMSALSIDQDAEIIPDDGAPSLESTSSEGPRNSLDGRDGTADRLEDRLRSRLRSLPVSSDPLEPAGDTARSIPAVVEGDRIQNRRCSILRDQRSGTWRVVFDAEGVSQLDPTMEILPCLLLEKLQRRAAQSDLPEAILLSGEISRFRGRSYLLPTRWRALASSSNIQR